MEEKRFSFGFYSDWDSFIFWKPMNWRNFTFIHFYVEISCARILELDFAILGLHFNFDWFRKEPRTPF